MRPASDARVIFASAELRILEDSMQRCLVTPQGAIWSAMSLQDPAQARLPCLQMLLLSLLFISTPQRLLLLGLGGGDAVRFLRAHYPATHLTAVESDAEVLRLAQRYFALPDADSRFTLLLSDAAHALQQPAARFDVILLDIVTGMQQPEDYQHDALFEQALGRLHADGVVAINFIVADADVLGACVARLKRLFNGVIYCLPVPEHHNVILYLLQGSAAQITLQQLQGAAVDFQRHTGLALLQAVQQLRRVSAGPRQA